MIIFGFSVVKNESDIIEAWVRYHLGLLDGLYVIDNDSTDSTREILDRLAREFPALRVGQDPSVGHVQEKILTRAVAELVANADFDYAIPLDADEFVRCDGRAALEAGLDAIPAHESGVIPWITYVPTPGDDASEANPLVRIVHRRAAEPRQYYKVVIPYATATLPDFRLTAGNHEVVSRGKLLSQTKLPGVTLAHFPVRSAEQLASKVLTGEWALNVKLRRQKGEGAHWRQLAKKVAARRALAPEELQSVAAAYAADRAEAVVADPIKLPAPFALKWPDLAKVDFTDRVVQFSAAHFSRLDQTVMRSEYMAIGKSRWGLLAYQLADTVIGRSIKLYGEWAAEEIWLLGPYLDPGDVVIDVGANIGTHTVALAKRVGPAGAVHAFEPQRLSFQLLCANAALNGLTNVHCYQQGVGAAPGTARVPLPDLERGSNVGRFALGQAQEGEAVPVVTLDSLDLPAVKLIKIDVEGMEADVVRGARALISRTYPVLFVENNIPEKSAELIRSIQDLGYRCWWQLASYYNPKNFFSNPTNIFASVDRPEINLLCLPDAMEPESESVVPVTGPDDTWQAAQARSKRS